MPRFSRALLCAAVLLAGCAPTFPVSSGGPSAFRDRNPMIDVNVQVHNDHYGPVLVTAVWEDMTYFLGEVGADETMVFRLPGYLVARRGGPRLLADPRGSTQEFLTDPVQVDTARWIQWTLKRNLHPSRPYVM